MKSSKNNKKVIFLRSTSIINDSRASKEINTLVRNGFEVIVLGWDRDGFAVNQPEQVKEYKLKFFKKKATYGGGIKNLFSLLLFQIWLFFKLTINISKYSIIHACDFDTAIPAKIVAKIGRKKLVYDIFDYYVHSHKVPVKIEQKIEKAEIGVINKADVTIICNEGRYKQIEKANPKKVIVIHNTPNIPENFEKEVSVIKNNSNKVKIAYVGILQGNRLLEELSEEMKNEKDIELHIGGFGRLAEVFENQEKEQENVFFYGKMKYNDVLKLESECDILFATYNPEIKNHKFSAPNKIYEAMALGKPIIVCEDTGVDKIIKENNLGQAIPYDGKEMIRAIKEITSNNDLMKEISKNAKSLYENKYSWKIMENSLMSTYKELIDTQEEKIEV